jgi:hypothetical protein
VTAPLHIVTAAFAKVSLGGNGGNRVARFVQRGDLVPEGVDSEQLERLTARGLIAPVELEVEPEPVVPADIVPAPAAKSGAKPAIK